MLRLIVQESLPWIDSRGRQRSPLEQFQFLDESFRSAGSKVRGDLTFWELGVLTASPVDFDTVKARWLSGPEAAMEPGFAVGYENASRLGRRLAGLWSEVMAWLAGDLPVWIWMSDIVDLLTGEPIGEDQSSWTQFVLDHGLRVTNAGGGFYTGLLSPSELRRVVEHWWPSGLGGFAGVTVSDPAIAARIGEQGTLRVEDISAVKHHFQVSRSYDNLGLVLMTPQMTWSHLRSELENHGLYTGRPLNVDPASPVPISDR